MFRSMLIVSALIVTIGLVGGDKVVFGDGKRLEEIRATRVKRQSQTLPTSTLTDENKLQILKVHEDIREVAGANAGNMLQMEYSEDLADLAQETANTCRFENANLNHDSVGDVGQVIVHTSTSSLPDPPFNAAVNAEKAAYDFTTNTCQAGQTCSNYKQILWYSSNKVGCGKKFCPFLFLEDGSRQFSQWFWVCNYQEVGAFEDERPYIESDEPCSLCNLDPGTKCVRNQCSTCDPTTDASCRGFNETLCVQDIDSCCSQWDSTTYCSPDSDRFGYMKENCGALCEIYFCGSI